MKRWAPIFLAAVAAAAVTWLAASSREAVLPAATPSPLVARTVDAPRASSDVAIPRVAFAGTTAASPAPRRNLFAYVERPRAAPSRAAAAAVPPVVLPVVETPARVTAAPVPEPPAFPFELIGRFGSDDDPVLAFARDGEVVTARRGDRVAGFVVRKVSRDAVEVANERGAVRVGLRGE